MAIKTKQQIKEYLNQCGDLDYQEFIDFIDSVVFNGENQEDPAPICQVTRYRRFRDVASTISIPALFNEDNDLLAVTVTRKAGGDFVFKIGTTDGGNEMGTFTMDRGKDNFEVGTTFEGNAPTPIFISGFDANVCDVTVTYNSFLCDDNGNISMTLIEEMQEALLELAGTVTTNAENFQEQLNNLSNALIQIPPGTIVIWGGGIANIPVGWSLYNEYLNRIPIGAGDKYAVGEPYGAEEVALTPANGPEHYHMTVVNEDMNTNSFPYEIGRALSAVKSMIKSWYKGSGGGRESYHMYGQGGNFPAQQPDVSPTSKSGNGHPFKIIPPVVGSIFIIKD